MRNLNKMTLLAKVVIKNQKENFEQLNAEELGNIPMLNTSSIIEPEHFDEGDHSPSEERKQKDQGIQNKIGEILKFQLNAYKNRSKEKMLDVVG